MKNKFSHIALLLMNVLLLASCGHDTEEGLEIPPVSEEEESPDGTPIVGGGIDSQDFTITLGLPELSYSTRCSIEERTDEENAPYLTDFRWNVGDVVRLASFNMAVPSVDFRIETDEDAETGTFTCTDDIDADTFEALDFLTFNMQCISTGIGSVEVAPERIISTEARDLVCLYAIKDYEGNFTPVAEGSILKVTSHRGEFRDAVLCIESREFDQQKWDYFYLHAGSFSSSRYEYVSWIGLQKSPNWHIDNFEGHITIRDHEDTFIYLPAYPGRSSVFVSVLDENRETLVPRIPTDNAGKLYVYEIQ